LLRITYISEESAPFSVSALLELLQQCHLNNPRQGLTGLLIYGNGTFLQSIEGEAEAVKALVEKISQDQRHRGFRILRKEMATERLYGDWSTRFERLTEESLRKVPGLREFAIKSSTVITSIRMSRSPTYCLRPIASLGSIRRLKRKLGISRSPNCGALYMPVSNGNRWLRSSSNR